MAVAEEGLALFRALDHKPGMAQALNIIGELTRTYGDQQRAWIAYDECLQLVRETGETRRESMILANLGFRAAYEGDIDRAQQLFQQSLDMLLQVGHDKHLIVSGVLGLVYTIAAKGDAERAVRLIGAADAWLEIMGAELQPGDQPEHERTLALVRSQLDAATFDRCWNEGRHLSLEQMVAFALKPTDG